MIWLRPGSMSAQSRKRQRRKAKPDWGTTGFIWSINANCGLPTSINSIDGCIYVVKQSFLSKSWMKCLHMSQTMWRLLFCNPCWVDHIFHWICWNWQLVSERRLYQFWCRMGCHRGFRPAIIRVGQRPSSLGNLDRDDADVRQAAIEALGQQSSLPNNIL